MVSNEPSSRCTLLCISPRAPKVTSGGANAGFEEDGASRSLDIPVLASVPYAVVFCFGRGRGRGFVNDGSSDSSMVSDFASDAADAARALAREARDTGFDNDGVSDSSMASDPAGALAARRDAGFLLFARRERTDVMLTSESLLSTIGAAR